MKSTLSLIIPTLNAEREIGFLLESLFNQSLALGEVIVVDSSSEDSTVEIVKKYPNVQLIEIERKDFNHGLTRDMAFRVSVGDIVCFMTQDAIPANDCFIENLVRPILDDPSVAVSSGRQLPKADARRFEQLVREFNYVAESNVRSKNDIPKYGIKTFFVSDVCAAYRREAYFACGGFGETDMSEDMLMAAKVIHAGWKVAYAADAKVYHSHNLSLREQYERNYAIGRFLEKNATLLSEEKEESEGGRLAKKVAAQLAREGSFFELARFGADCVARFLGNRKGHKAAKQVEEAQ